MKKKVRLQLRESLMSDVHFLKSHGLMDYSLLLGIEKTNTKPVEEETYKFDNHKSAAIRPSILRVAQGSFKSGGDLLVRKHTLAKPTSRELVEENMQDNRCFDGF